MNLDPLLAGIAAASGGSTLLCYLKIRELTDRVWGISPLPYDFAPWTHGMVVSLVICLLSLIILTWSGMRGARTLVMGVTAAGAVAGGWLFVIGPALVEGARLSASRACCFEGPDPLWGLVGVILMALVLVLTLVAMRAGMVEE